MIDKFFSTNSFKSLSSLLFLLLLFLLSNYETLKVNQIEAIENDDHKIGLNLFRKSMLL